MRMIWAKEDLKIARPQAMLVEGLPVESLDWAKGSDYLNNRTPIYEKLNWSMFSCYCLLRYFPNLEKIDLPLQKKKALKKNNSIRIYLALRSSVVMSQASSHTCPDSLSELRGVCVCVW